MRLVMMGTGAFALPTFQALYGTHHQAVALITQPARDPKVAPSPLRAVADGHGTPIFAPENINAPEGLAILRETRPDALVVCDYGQILSPEALSAAPHGGVNLHGSLLPKYRGAAPVNWAILRGETETGVTIIQMSPRVDAGPTLARATLAIDPNENALELEGRLAALGAPLVCQVLEDLERGEAVPLPQDSAHASGARRLRKTDGIVDWTRSAVEIHNQVRGLEPWPKAFTFWHRPRGEPLRLILARVSSLDKPADVAPGTVLATMGEGGADQPLLVATGNGMLAVHQLQPAGKRVLSAQEFLRGYPLEPGALLGGVGGA